MSLFNNVYDADARKSDARFRVAFARMFSAISASAVAIALASVARADPPPPCNAWDVDYQLSANVTITDTMMGAGDGTHVSGPGKVRIRYENVNGAPGGAAKVIDYSLNDHHEVTAKVTLFEAHVIADTVSHTTANACGVSAEGALNGRSLKWGSWTGMHATGQIQCSGSLCGKFGAPPQGTSAVNTPAHDVSFKPFEFSEDKKTFTMDDSIVAKQSSPAQTSHLTLAGREVSRACVVAKPCP